jgi:hypothetical protein
VCEGRRADPERESKFDLQSARSAAEAGDLEAWVHRYLNGPGRNPAFSDGLAREERYWRGPLSLELRKLERTCGPEPEMPFREPVDRWLARVDALVACHDGVETQPPLIVQYESGRLRIRDGNHRYAALGTLGFDRCWAIVWYADRAAFSHHEDRGFAI